MANQKRTEVDLKIGTKKFTLRASYEVISQIETHMDMAVMEVLEKVGASKLKATDIATIIYYALQPLHASLFEPGGEFEVDSAARFESGLGEALLLNPIVNLTAIMDLLSIAVTGNRVSTQVKSKKEVKGKK